MCAKDPVFLPALDAAWRTAASKYTASGMFTMPDRISLVHAFSRAGSLSSDCCFMGAPALPLMHFGEH